VSARYVTASEKLRALAARWDLDISDYPEDDPYGPDDEYAWPLVRALPLIADVVEAAENEAHRLHPTTMELCADPMCRALSALQDHLAQP
jgi:hypothetical protein